MLIGLCGYKQSGKSTVASLLQAEYGFHPVSFADPLRKLAYDINPVVGYAVQQALVLGAKPQLVPVYYAELIDRVGYEKSKQVDEVRRFLQRLGTEGMRANFGDNVWVELAAARVEEMQAAGQHIVMADIRFPNEADFVLKYGQLWRINRPGFEGDNHASEAHIKALPASIDIHAENIEDLRRIARESYAERVRVAEDTLGVIG